MLFLAAFILKVRSKGNIINYMTHLLLNLRLVLFKMISNKKVCMIKFIMDMELTVNKQRKEKTAYNF